MDAQELREVCQILQVHNFGLVDDVASILSDAQHQRELTVVRAALMGRWRTELPAEAKGILLDYIEPAHIEWSGYHEIDVEDWDPVLPYDHRRYL